MSSAVALVLFLAFAVLNWSSGAEDVVRHSTVRVLFMSAQCIETRKESKADFLLGNDQLRNFFSLQNSGQIGVDALAPPLVDFSKESLLYLSMGERPTAGYGISLSQEQFLYSKDEAEIGIVWEEPGVNAVVAQVITSPCVLLAVSKEKYKDIRVVDQLGISRWVLSVP